MLRCGGKCVEVWGKGWEVNVEEVRKDVAGGEKCGKR